MDQTSPAMSGKRPWQLKATGRHVNRASHLVFSSSCGLAGCQDALLRRSRTIQLVNIIHSSDTSCSNASREVDQAPAHVSVHEITTWRAIMG